MDDNLNTIQKTVTHVPSQCNAWSWTKTEEDLLAMHMDPFYTISTTSGLQLRKTFNFNHAIGYLAATTSFGGETFIAVQSLASKSIVHIWNTGQHKNCKVKLNYRINSFIVISTLMIGVALCGDGKLRVFTSVPTLVEVASFDLVKPATYPLYNPFRKDILLGGISEVNVWSFCEVEKRAGRPKNPLTEAVKMDLERGQSFSPNMADQWVTCIVIDEKSTQVVIAGESIVSIVDANTYLVKHVIKTHFSPTITQVTLYVALDYAITGHQDGSVNFWSILNGNNAHRIKAHQAKLTGLEVHYDMGLLITISLDKTIKVIRLSTFEEVYNIMTGEKMSHLRVLDRNSLAYCTQYSVKVWNLYQVDSLVNRLFSEVHCMRRTGEGQMLVDAEDGGLRLMGLKDGEIITTVFNTSNTNNFSLKFSAYSRSRNMVFVLNPSLGHVEGYNCETHPAELTLFYKTEGQQVSAICEAYLGIPFWLPTAKRCKTRTETMLSLLLVATAEGRLAVADAPDWLHLPQPLNIERGIVRDMEASTAGEGGKKCTLAVLTGTSPSYISVYLLSISTDHNLSINLRHVLTLTTPISLFMVSDVHLLLTFNNFMSLVKFPSILEKDGLHCTVMDPNTVISESYVEISKQSVTDAHTAAITDFDALNSLEIFVTVSAGDCFLKVWDNKNMLLREIMFSSPVYGIVFATDFGALFCTQNSNVNVIPVVKFLPPQYIQRLLNLDWNVTTTTDTLVAVPSVSSGTEPDVLSLSLYERRKEKARKQERTDGRFSKYGRKKRDPPRDDDSSKGGPWKEEGSKRGGSGGSGGSSRQDTTSSRQSMAPVSGTSDRSHKQAALEVVEEIQTLQMVPQNSEFTIIETVLPCAPDGFIPNSITKLMFAHLKEFRILMSARDTVPPHKSISSKLSESSQSFTILSIPSKRSVRSTVVACAEYGKPDLSQVHDFVSSTSEVVNNMLDVFPNILGPDMSRLFMSTTSIEPSEQGSLSPVQSAELIDVINNSKQSVHEKRSAFTGIALKEAPSYANSERVPKSIDHKSNNGDQNSLISITNSVETVTVQSDVAEDAEMIMSELVTPITSVKIKSPALRKPSRRASVLKPKKVRPNKKNGEILKPNLTNAEPGEFVESNSVQRIEAEEVPIIQISVPELKKTKSSQISFKESLRELEQQQSSSEKLLSIAACFDSCKRPNEYLNVIKKFDKFLNGLENETLDDEEVSLIISVASDLHDSHKIDTIHFTELLKTASKCDMAEFMKFKLLTAIIKVQAAESKDPNVVKEVLMGILPFLVHEDELIKSKAFEEISVFADINTQEDLRVLLVSMGVLPESCKPDVIDIASNGKVLNIQYWKNEIGSPQPNVSTKTSEELQIVSEFEIAIDPSYISLPREDRSNTMISNQSLPSCSKKINSKKTLSVDLVRKQSPQPTLTPPGSLADPTTESNYTSDAYLEPDPGISEDEDKLVHVPSVDIKRKILKSNDRAVMVGNQSIGTFRDKGKLYNSSNDLMFWYDRDDDLFYDTDSKVVGSLLPDGSVSVPDDLHLIANYSIASKGKELVEHASSCDSQGTIKDRKGVALGKLTKEGEFISRDGILYNCDGNYVGKQCQDGNRMYANGEIFDKQNNYWGHVGPDNTTIHLSGVILDSSGIKIGNIEDYGGKLNKCVRNFDLDDIKTDSGVSIESGYANREIIDEEGGILGKFKNKDTIITTCGDIFDRGGAYLGQLLANGQVMIKEEATRLCGGMSRSNMITQCRSRTVPDAETGLPRKGRAERLRTAVMEHEIKLARQKKREEIGSQWSKNRQLPSHVTPRSDQGYGSEDKLLFDISQSLPILPTLNEIKGQRLVKTITFSRSMSSFPNNRNFTIEPMPSKLNAHTSTVDGNTQFGMLKVDWTTRSIDPDTALPLLLPPPPSVAAVVSPPITLPRLPRIHHDFTPDRQTANGDYLMKMASTYLKKEIDEEMRNIRTPKSVDIRGKMHNTPILSARKT